MKKKKKQTEVEHDESLIGQELNILSELLVDFDFEYEDCGTFFEGGLEFKRIKVLSLKSGDEVVETKEDEKNPG